MAQAVEAPASTMAEGQTSHTQNQAAPSIYELMALVMNDVRDVGKNGFNEHQKYKFRGVDDFIGALAQPLRDHGVFMMTEILDFQTSVRGKMNATHMRVAFHFYGPAGDKVTATTLGEASDTADKASNKAMSAALKYALMQTFMIPVDAGSLDDGDRDHPVGQSSPADSYMQRLRKPAVWNNVTALQAMHSEAKADGLLQETVYAPGGEEMALGELIVARGRTLRAEAAEREARQAAEAPAVAAQVAAETGGGVEADPASDGESVLDGFMRRVRNGWNSIGPTEMALAEAKQKGINDVVPFDGDHLHIQDVLEIRLKALKEQAAQGGDTERSAV